MQRGGKLKRAPLLIHEIWYDSINDSADTDRLMKDAGAALRTPLMPGKCSLRFRSPALAHDRLTASLTRTWTSRDALYRRTPLTYLGKYCVAGWQLRRQKGTSPDMRILNDMCKRAAEAELRSSSSSQGLAVRATVKVYFVEQCNSIFSERPKLG